MTAWWERQLTAMPGSGVTTDGDVGRDRRAARRARGHGRDHRHGRGRRSRRAADGAARLAAHGPAAAASFPRRRRGPTHDGYDPAIERLDPADPAAALARVEQLARGRGEDRDRLVARGARLRGAAASSTAACVATARRGRSLELAGTASRRRRAGCRRARGRGRRAAGAGGRSGRRRPPGEYAVVLGPWAVAEVLRRAALAFGGPLSPLADQLGTRVAASGDQPLGLAALRGDAPALVRRRGRAAPAAAADPGRGRAPPRRRRAPATRSRPGAVAGTLPEHLVLVGRRGGRPRRALRCRLARACSSRRSRCTAPGCSAAAAPRSPRASASIRARRARRARREPDRRVRAVRAARARRGAHRAPAHRPAAGPAVRTHRLGDRRPGRAASAAACSWPAPPDRQTSASRPGAASTGRGPWPASRASAPWRPWVTSRACELRGLRRLGAASRPSPASAPSRPLAPWPASRSSRASAPWPASGALRGLRRLGRLRRLRGLRRLGRLRRLRRLRGLGSLLGRSTGFAALRRRRCRAGLGGFDFGRPRPGRRRRGPLAEPARSAGRPSGRARRASGVPGSGRTRHGRPGAGSGAWAAPLSTATVPPPASAATTSTFAANTPETAPPPVTVTADAPPNAARARAALSPTVGATGSTSARSRRWRADLVAELAAAGALGSRGGAARCAATTRRAGSRAARGSPRTASRAPCARGDQRGAGLEHERLHLLAAAAEHVGDLVVRHVAELREHERGALLLGQAGDVAQQVAQVLSALDLGGEVLGRRLDQLGGRLPRRARAAP